MVRNAIIAAALALAASGAGATDVALQPGETLLEVQAEGEAKAVPDIAEFTTGITSDGATAQAAMAANAAAADKLIGAIDGAGIAGADVQTSELSVHPRFRQDENGDDTDEIISYRAGNSLTVRLHDVSRAPELLDALFAAGATDLSGPDFSFADEALLTAQARADAVAKAKRKAADYADAFGMKVGRVLRVSERSARGGGGGEIVVTASRIRAPIRPGEQSITVNVWVDFALVSE
jgi:uncharacterized protein YggE